MFRVDPRFVRRFLVPHFSIAPLFLALLLAPGAFAAPVGRHTDSSTAPIKGPVWATTLTQDGDLVVGSNTLAVFDGAGWHQLATPETAYAFRGLATERASGRIYVGAINAIGYLEKSGGRPNDGWRFVSLTREAALAGVERIGDVWHVLVHGDAAFFVLSDRLIRYRDGTFETWTLPNSTHLSAFAADGQMWIYQQGVGLHRLQADGPQLEVGEPALPKSPVTWIAPPFIGLADEAFRWNDRGFERIAGLSGVLQGTLPSAAERVADGMLAIGTFKSGVILARPDGDVAGRIDSHSGLGDDNVYSLHAFGLQLWVGVGTGLSRFDALGRAEILDSPGLFKSGVPVGVVSHGGKTYLAGSRGIDFVTGDAPIPRTLLADEAKLWDASVTPSGLWAGSFGGIWRLQSDTLEVGQPPRFQKIHSSPRDIVRVAASSRVPDGIIFLEGYELRSLSPAPLGGWASRPLGGAVTDTPVALLEDSQGSVWVATATDGIFRFAWSDGASDERPFLRFVARYRAGAGLPVSATRVTALTTVGDRLVAFADTPGGVLEFKADQSASRFAPVEGFEDFRGIAVSRSASEAYWVLRHHALPSPAVVRVTLTAQGFSWEPVPSPGIDQIGQIVAIDHVGQDSPQLWLSGQRGFLRIELRETPQPAAARYPLNLHATASSGPTRGWRFPSPAVVGGELLFYQTRLDGVEPEWSAPQLDPVREFTGLAPGGYRFLARAVDRWGRSGEPATLQFAVPAPWWRTRPAYAAYLAAALALGLGIARWRIVRLKRQNERLNLLVAERTRALDERTRELDLINARKSEFLADISHEIRNPLNGITGLVGMLGEVAHDSRQTQIARSLSACASTLKRVFEEVLDFSKLEHGPVPVRTRAFELDTLIHEVAEVFRTEADRVGCTLTVRLPETGRDWRFLGDDEKLRTIVSNFAGNALKYAPGFPVEISVELDEPGDDGTGPVVVTIGVTDSGPGIPPAEQELVFKKFVRGTQARHARTPGAGLGLASCKALAELIGGHVGLESHPGTPGAAFFVQVPLLRTTRETNETSGGEARVQKFTPVPGSAGRALIVDDQDYNRLVAEQVARRLGYEPTSAANAHEALRHFDDAPFDLVLLDWEMPVMKGGDLCRVLRKRRGGADAVIIATTAHDSEDVRRDCFASGMDGFVLKPFGEASLGQVIAACQPARGGEASERVSFRTTATQSVDVFGYLGDGDPEKSDAAAERYLAVLEEEISTLSEAVRKISRETIAAASHRLRSHAALTGSSTLQQAARTMQDVANAATAGEIVRHHHEILAAAERVRATVADYRSSIRLPRA